MCDQLFVGRVKSGCEKGFHPPYTCFHLHPKKASSKTAHPSQHPNIHTNAPHPTSSQTPMPLREDLEGTKKTGDIFATAPVPCPIDCAHNMPLPVCQRTSQRLTKKEEQKRKTKDPFSRKRTVEGKLRCNLTLICLQVEPRTRSTFTWHCYTRRSSCGLTTGSICDRRKVKFPLTLYTHLPPSLTSEASLAASPLKWPSLSQSRTPTRSMDAHR